MVERRQRDGGPDVRGGHPAQRPRDRHGLATDGRAREPDDRPERLVDVGEGRAGEQSAGAPGPPSTGPLPARRPSPRGTPTT